MAKKLEVNNLIISFRTNNGTVKAVRDISFDLEKGETLAIVGESGSGKSVTARAIMGILAKNAIPEGGEIIYDGQDLMKIDEEDFHKIRGNRISMIFQDPLSSLNPIVRIGKQLTEAMILNGKANQREAKRVYTAKTKLLRAEMKEAGVADVDAKFSIFDKVTAEGSKLESGYNYSRERAESMMKNIEAVLIDSIDQEPKKVAKEMKLIKADEKNLYNPYLIDKGKSELPSLMEAFSNAIPEYVATGKHEKTDGLLRKMQGLLKKVLETTMPDFYAMAYCRMNNAMPAYHDDNAALNSEMQAIFNERFLDSFHKDVAAGIENSNRKSFDKKGSIVESLNTALEKMSGEGRIDLKVAKEETRKCATEIENALDKLAINKDSIAYTFKSSITAAVNTYGESLRVEKLKHPGKKDRMFKDRMDIDLYQNNIRLILTHARDSFQNQLDSAEKLNAEDLSNEMVKFLCNESSKRVFKVTKRKAQIRAIEAHGRERYAGRAHGGGGHRQCPSAVSPVSLRVLRRHAPAYRYRHRSGGEPGHPDLRRAHHGFGRDDPGPDPRADQQAEGRAPAVHHLHHPRSGRGGQHGGQDRRHVCRQDRGIRHGGRRLLRSSSSVHLGPALLHAGSGHQGEAGRHPGHPAQHDLPAQGRCVC